jgi:ABC-2 type transport system permease protein
MITYAKYEIVRTFRNRRFFVFSIGFPLVLFFVIAGPNRNVQNFLGSGIPAPLYYMIGLTAFGTMTPLSTRAYFRTKVVVAYLLALITIVVLYASGISLGVHLAAGEWARMTGLILVGLLPFAAIGSVFGHVLTPDSIGPAMGGATALFALLGGTWFPITGGVMQKIGEALPSYWVVQASHVALGGKGWTTTGWIVVAIWTVAGTAVARWAYRRDTQRV